MAHLPLIHPRNPLPVFLPVNITVVLSTSSKSRKRCIVEMDESFTDYTIDDIYRHLSLLS
jgi:hypothetical protein